MKKAYESEARKLAAAIDIALESFQKHVPEDWTTDNLKHVIRTYSEWKSEILNPKPEFGNLRSLKYVVNDVFTFFQEGAGKTVEYFWLRLKEEKLDFVREDKLQKILERGKIKGRAEYDYVTDILVAMEQEGRISEAVAARLSQMIGDYENGKSKKKQV